MKNTRSRSETLTTDRYKIALPNKKRRVIWIDPDIYKKVEEFLCYEWLSLKETRIKSAKELYDKIAKQVTSTYEIDNYINLEEVFNDFLYDFLIGENDLSLFS